MAKETESSTWTGWGMREATKHGNAVTTYLQKLSQARDLHDRANAHVEFVQMHMEIFNDRAKALSNAVAEASNFMGIFVSLLQRRKHFEDMVRNSPHTERPAETSRNAGAPKDETDR